MLVLLWKPLVRAHSLAKNICLLSISLSVLADLRSCSLQLLLWLPFQYVQTGGIFCPGSALGPVPPQTPSPGCTALCGAAQPEVPFWPGNANSNLLRPFVLILLLKEQWCELWDTWANSSWKILLKRTSFSSDYRKCYSSLSVLPKMGVISLLIILGWISIGGCKYDENGFTTDLYKSVLR